MVIISDCLIIGWLSKVGFGEALEDADTVRYCCVDSYVTCVDRSVCVSV